MSKPRGLFDAAIAAMLAGAACGGGPAPAKAPATPAVKSAPRQLGSWSGSGNSTLGFVSESGSFRITWKAVPPRPGAEPGHFQLTLRSGISGRPLRVIADHRGPGGGSIEFGDDPRMYEFLVDSAGLAWSISVDETFTARE